MAASPTSSVWPSMIRLQTGSAVIQAASRPLLTQLAEMARSCPGELLIEGHTDDVGDAAMNRDLSQRRAQSVLEALIDLKVPPGRLTASGFGESRPLASNSTSVGRAQNRRIEIRVADFN
ncbi:MAG: OmpA family protein [Bacteroidota bacterium]